MYKIKDEGANNKNMANCDCVKLINLPETICNCVKTTLKLRCLQKKNALKLTGREGLAVLQPKIVWLLALLLLPLIYH